MTDRIETALSEMLGDGLVMLGAGPLATGNRRSPRHPCRVAHDGAVVTRFDPGSEAIYFNPEVARATGLAMLAAG